MVRRRLRCARRRWLRVRGARRVGCYRRETSRGWSEGWRHSSPGKRGEVSGVVWGVPVVLCRVTRVWGVEVWHGGGFRGVVTYHGACWTTAILGVRSVRREAGCGVRGIEQTDCGRMVTCAMHVRRAAANSRCRVSLASPPFAFETGPLGLLKALSV